MGNTKEVMMILTENCNLACTYCFEHHKSNKRMNFEIAKKIIDFEMNLQDEVDECRFTMFGGEPMLEFELIKGIYSYIEENLSKWNKKVLIFIDTNGTLMNEETKSWIKARKKVVHCGLSLDGTKAMHDINRSNSFDKIDLDFYKECWPNQSVKMTVSAETLPHLAEGVKYIQKLGYECGCTFAYGIEWSEELIEILRKQLEELVEFYTENLEYSLCQILNIDLSGILYEPVRNYKRCSAGKFVKAYDTEGNLYPCHTFTPVGLGDKAIQFQNYVLPEEDIVEEEKCINCKYHIICPTCYGANYVYTNSISNRSDWLCEFFKLCVQASSVIQFRRISKKEKDKVTEQDYATLIAIKELENME